MSGSTLGKPFCITSFGESHGPAIGCVVDGCPPGMALAAEDTTFTATTTPLPPTVTYTPTNTLTIPPTFTATIPSASTVTFTPAPCTNIIYVNVASGSGSPDGCGWGTAFSRLQDALAVASSGKQIWVAAGTYYPDEVAGQTNDSRDSTFRLINGVSVYGGFAGTETLLSQRNPSCQCDHPEW